MKGSAVEMHGDDAIRVGGDLDTIAAVVTVEVEHLHREEVGVGIDDHLLQPHGPMAPQKFEESDRFDTGITTH
jgi:hypothetical protein